MRTTTTLMLLTASLAPLPLFAEEQAPTPAACFADILAPTQQPVMTLQQRAEQFSAAAILPADADMALVISCQNQNRSNTVFPNILSHTNSLAFGLAKGTSNTFAALNTLQVLVPMPELSENVAAEWQKSARESLRALINHSKENIKQQTLAQTIQTTAQIAIQPIYLIASPKAGEENEFHQLVKQFEDMLSARVAAIPHAESIEVDGLQGVQFYLDNAVELADTEDFDDETTLLLQTFSERPLYFLYGMRGDQFVCVLCEHPEDIRWAESAEQSVLATEAWSALDACPDAPTALVATLSPALIDGVCQWGLEAPCNIVLSELNMLFYAMGGKESADADVFRAAAAGLNTIVSETAAQQQPATKPTVVQIQESERTLRISLQGDADGFSYKEGQLRLTSLADAPQSILYFEGTAPQYQYAPDFGKQLKAAEAVLDGGLATLRPEELGEINAGMQVIKSYQPELKEAGEALMMAGESLGNTAAFVVDATEQVPTFLCQENGKTALLPRVALYSGVNDRTKLASGWNKLLSAVGKALGKNGLNPQLVSTLPIAASSSDGIDSYSLVMPFLTADMGGNVTVSDTAFTIGSSANLNREIVNSATGSIPFAGSVFSLNFGQLAKTARSIAELSKNSCSNEDTDDEMCEDAESVVEFLEYVSTVFDKVTGATTVRDGVEIIRIDFRKK